MNKEIWLGPILGNNRERLIERCSSMLKSAFRPVVTDSAAGATGGAYAPAVDGPGFLYLSASRPLLDLVSSSLLDAADDKSIWGTLPVHLFNGFVSRVISSAIDLKTGKPLTTRLPIDREDLPLKRSLLARIAARFAVEGRIKTLAPLTGLDGCVNSIASIIGEIQRAGKSPAEFAAIVASRTPDLFVAESCASDELGGESRDTTASANSGWISQSDFDREISLIYSEYRAALDRASYSEEDAKQLLALDILRGSLDSRSVAVPWLDNVQFLVLDGFFDFTPIQGEMLRLLIPRIENVVVSLNYDLSNTDVFRAFEHTIEQLAVIAPFEIRTFEQARRVSAVLEPLRSRLFNSGRDSTDAERDKQQIAPDAPFALTPPDPKPTPNIRLFECDDREAEIATIAREIKRLVLQEGIIPWEIGLVVRELASYADTIIRVFHEQSIPLALEQFAEAERVPAVRAALKLLDVFEDHAERPQHGLKMTLLADLVKTGYFRLPSSDLDELRGVFRAHRASVAGRETRRQISLWNPDQLENVVAYIGEPLNVDAWLRRARAIAAAAIEKQDSVAGAESQRPASGSVIQSQDENSEPVEPDDSGEGDAPLSEGADAANFSTIDIGRQPRHVAAVEPAELIWSALVFERLQEIIRAVPLRAQPAKLKSALMAVFERLEFANEIRRPLNSADSDSELSRIALDLRGLELLRHAITAAVKAFEMTEGANMEIPLADFLAEVRRAASSVSLRIAGADSNGVRTLEVTDVRGLSFRAVFIAGLVESGFPLRPGRDWLYPQEQRENLKAFGLTLEDRGPDTMLKEEHYFYQAACRATERLYLTRPLTGEDGASTVASYYIDEVRRAIDPVELKAEIVHHDFNGERVTESSTTTEAAISLLRLAARFNRSPQAEALKQKIFWARQQGYISRAALRAIRIEGEREGLQFSSFDGLITDAEAALLVSAMFGAFHVFSASGLNLYGNCPFKFFASRLLRLQPRGEAAIDLSALDSGSLLHEILRRFFSRHRGQRLDRLEPVALAAELNLVADEVFDERQRELPPLSPPVWKIDREIRKVLLQQVLDYERGAEQQTGGKDVRPARFEVSYGMNAGEFDPDSTPRKLELPRPGNNSADSEIAPIRGRIDRVDIAADGTVTAYDYKLSRSPAVKDMREGRDVQIAIYLEALERLLAPGRPLAGGGYYTLRGGRDRRNNGLYRKSHIAYTGIKSPNASMEDEDWLELREKIIEFIWTYIDGMRAGEFRPTPSLERQTCSTCDYLPVCRYDVFRIRRKLNSESAGN